MATPNNNNNRSSSDESPECRTMRENYDKMVDLLSPSINRLARTLFSREIIPKGIMDKLRMNTLPDADKAGELLSYLMNTIKHNPSVFHEFVKILEELDPSNKMIIEMLAACYKSHTVIPDVSSLSLKNREQENKSGHESAEPKGIPPTVLKVLQSIHCQVGALIEDQANETQLNEDRRSSLAESGIDTIVNMVQKCMYIYILQNHRYNGMMSLTNSIVLLAGEMSYT